MLAALSMCLTLPVALSAQGVELDHVLARVNGRLVTASDVRQARMLRLVDDDSSDAAIQHALEDRWLILGEMSRREPVLPPSAQAIADRRAARVARLGGAAAVPKLLADAGMSDKAYESWLADDLRIEGFLAVQFGSTAEADRAKAQTDWLARLRQRAGLR